MPDRIVRVRLIGDVGGFIAPITAAGKATYDAAAKMTAADKQAVKFRSGLKELGTTAGFVGLAAAAGLGLAVKSAAEFNAQMALVKTLAHASPAEMKQLSDAALSIGQAWGYTAGQVADGEEELVKAGVSVKDILGGALQGTLALAAAGQTSVATATEIAAAAMTQFGLAGKDIPHLADLLAAGADKALGSVEDLGNALTYAGTTAAQMGLSVEQTTGSLTALAQAGITGDMAGTAFRQMLIKLSAPSKKAQDTMDDLGLSLYTANGQIKTMPELADNLQQSLSKLTPQQRNSALATIFGARAIQSANVFLKDGAKGIQDWIDKVNDQGFAAHQAGGKLDSLSGDLSKFKAALNAAFIETGQGGQGPLRSLVQNLTSATNAFNRLSPAAKNAAAELLAITAVTGGGLWLGSKVIRGVADTRKALTDMGITAEITRDKLLTLGNAARAGAGIGALALSMTNLDEKAHLSNTAMGALYGTMILPGWGTAIGGIIGLIKDFGANSDEFNAKVAQMKTGLESAVQSGDVAQLQAMQKQISALADAIPDDLPGPLKDTVQPLRDLAKEAANASVNATGMSAAVDSAGNALTGAGAGATEMTKALEEAQKKASATTKTFLGFTDSLNNSKVSLGDWINQMAKQAAALRDFTSNAQTAARRGLDDGLIASLEEAGAQGALRMKQLANATDAQIARANKAWQSGQRAALRYNAVVAGVADPTLDVNIDPAIRALIRIRRELANVPKVIRTQYYVTQVNRINKLPGIPLPGGVSAAGNIFPTVRRYAGGDVADGHQAELAGPGMTRVWREPETQGEAYIPLANDWRRPRARGIAAQTVSMLGGVAYFAAGGPAIGTAISLGGGTSHDLADAIRKLQAYLDHHDKLGKAQQAALQKQLDRLTKLQDAIKSFDLASVLPSKDPTNPIWAGVKGQLDELEKAIKAAGGHWTGAMHDHAMTLLNDAKNLDALDRKLNGSDGLLGHVDGLIDTLHNQQQAYDQLKSDMEAFGQQVADSFKANLFGLTDESGNQLAASASTILQGLSASTQNLNDFTKAFTTLAGEGLSPTVLAELGSKADLTSAINLAATLTPDQIAQINAAVLANQTAMAAAAAASGQGVYGQQLSDAKAALDATATAIKAATAVQAQLTAAIVKVGGQVEKGALDGTLTGMTKVIDALSTKLGAK